MAVRSRLGRPVCPVARLVYSHIPTHPARRRGLFRDRCPVLPRG